MSSEHIRLRENNEREAFSRIGFEGRSAVGDDSTLVLPEATIERNRLRLRGEIPPRTPLEQMFAFIGPSLAGKKMLEICCHSGEFGTTLARLGGEVTSVDIAQPLVEIAKRRARGQWSFRPAPPRYDVGARNDLSRHVF